MFWWIAALLAAAIVMVLFSDVRLRFRYLREGHNDEMEAEMTGLFGLVRLRRKVRTLELQPWLKGLRLRLERGGRKIRQEEGEAPELHYSRNDFRRFVRQARLLVRHMNDFKEFIAGTLQHVQVHDWQWTTRLGTGDAAETGVACGAVWGLKCAAAGAVGRWVALHSVPRIHVAPVFDAPHFRTELFFLARIRIFRLIASGVMLLIRVARRKGGLAVWARVLLRKNRKEAVQ